MRSFMTGEEKAFLKELVCANRAVIECKKTDAISVSKKKKAWLDIVKQFNSSAENSNRSIEQLKKCWENMKSRRRKELSAEKLSRMATGGGPYKPPTEDNLDIMDATLDIEIKDTIDSDTVITVGNTNHNYFLDYDVPIERGHEDNVFLQPVNTNLETLPTKNKNKKSNTSQDGADERNFDNREQEDDIVLESVPGPSHLETPHIHKNKRSYTSRGTAIERELRVRLERTTTLRSQDEELHQLRIKEQKIKIEEQEVRLAIAKEILKQEQIKTENLLNVSHNN